MVNASEQPFRMLCRAHGADLCYTPMFHSRLFVADPKYRERNFPEDQDCAQDRPLFVQFCGDDPATLLAAARLVEHRCDAIDLNLGCPQGIARRGHYGSFLLSEVELLERIVSKLSTGLSIPVTCKIRLTSTDASTRVADTIALCRRLQSAGCCILTVHAKRSKMRFGKKCFGTRAFGARAFAGVALALGSPWRCDPGGTQGWSRLDVRFEVVPFEACSPGALRTESSVASAHTCIATSYGMTSRLLCGAA